MRREITRTRLAQYEIVTGNYPKSFKLAAALLKKAFRRSRIGNEVHRDPRPSRSSPPLPRLRRSPPGAGQTQGTGRSHGSSRAGPAVSPEEARRAKGPAASSGPAFLLLCDRSDVHPELFAPAPGNSASLAKRIETNCATLNSGIRTRSSAGRTFCKRNCISSRITRSCTVREKRRPSNASSTKAAARSAEITVPAEKKVPSAFYGPD